MSPASQENILNTDWCLVDIPTAFSSLGSPCCLCEDCNIDQVVCYSMCLATIARPPCSRASEVPGTAEVSSTAAACGPWMCCALSGPGDHWDQPHRSCLLWSFSQWRVPGFCSLKGFSYVMYWKCYWLNVVPCSYHEMKGCWGCLTFV